MHAPTLVHACTPRGTARSWTRPLVATLPVARILRAPLLHLLALVPMTASAPPDPPVTPPRVVHLYKGQLLVARLQNTPGVVLPTVAPKDFLPPVQHPWASGQLFSAQWEPDVRLRLADSKSFEDFLKRVKHFKYRVEDSGVPTFKRRPFVRL